MAAPGRSPCTISSFVALRTGEASHSPSLNVAQLPLSCPVGILIIPRSRFSSIPVEKASTPLTKRAAESHYFTWGTSSSGTRRPWQLAIITRPLSAFFMTHGKPARVRRQDLHRRGRLQTAFTMPGIMVEVMLCPQKNATFPSIPHSPSHDTLPPSSLASYIISLQSEVLLVARRQVVLSCFNESPFHHHVSVLSLAISRHVTSAGPSSHRVRNFCALQRRIGDGTEERQNDTDGDAFPTMPLRLHHHLHRNSEHQLPRR